MNTNDNNKVYEIIAEHFDNTRFSLWNCVSSFMDILPPNSFVLDCGTGNGKYLKYRNDIIIQGLDMCAKLLQIAQQKYKDIDFIRCDATNLPYRDNTFDSIICIAMLHHLHTEELRKKCLYNLIRVTKPNGSMLITVWAREQKIKPKWIPVDNKPETGDYLIPWQMPSGEVVWRYYHLFTEQELKNLLQKTCQIISINYEMDNWVVRLKVPMISS